MKCYFKKSQETIECVDRHTTLGKSKSSQAWKDESMCSKIGSFNWAKKITLERDQLVKRLHFANEEANTRECSMTFPKITEIGRARNRI